MEPFVDMNKEIERLKREHANEGAEKNFVRSNVKKGMGGKEFEQLHYALNSFARKIHLAAKQKSYGEKISELGGKDR